LSATFSDYYYLLNRAAQLIQKRKSEELSELENQPLVILGALCAGIPRVLASLPTYQFLDGLKGGFLVKPGDPVAVSEVINRALDCPTVVRQRLERFWQDRHSPTA
jgi:glycosyltransferase involved in cell wall biosynthesis